MGAFELQRKPFVVYWNNIPSPYIVDRFNAVADRGEVDFEAWFSNRVTPGRSWDVDESNWRFRYRYLPVTKVGSRVLHWPTPVLGRRPDVLISLYAEPAFLVGWAVAKIRGVRTAFWCQVTWDSWVRRRVWKEAIKRFVFRKVDATLGSGEESRAFAMRYGTPSKNALLLLHSVDVTHFMNGRESIVSMREQLRRENGLKGTVFVYVGRLWWGKGIIHLLDAFELVQRQSANPVSLLLVGDGPEESALRRRCEERDIRNVVFAGFKQKPELPSYYAMADVFVFPTLGDPYGTVVDEAMACSLPIICTSATGEIRDRVEEGVNGYIVTPGEGAEMADRMLCLAEDPSLCVRMGRISAQRISGRTLERWAQDLEGIVDLLLERP